MSGSTIGAVAGAVVGFYLGGPAGARWGWVIGSMIGGYVDPVTTEGPRLKDVRGGTSSGVGAPITFGYGTYRTHCNEIWHSPTVDEHESTEGGKGGGTESKNFTYTTSYAIGVCEGEIAGFLIVFENSKIVYDQRSDADLTAVGYTAQQISDARAATSKWLANTIIYTGSETQNPDPTIESFEGVGNVAPFRGLSYFVRNAADVTDTQGAVPQYEVVVVGAGTVTETGADTAWSDFVRLYAINVTMIAQSGDALVMGRDTGSEWEYNGGAGVTSWTDLARPSVIGHYAMAVYGGTAYTIGRDVGSKIGRAHV